ncbi:hypothetical protein ACMYSQ_007976 [Aspergillus niger]
MGRFSAVDNGRSSITCMDFSYDSLAVEKLWRVLVLGILRKQTWAVWLLIVLRFRKFLIQEKEERRTLERGSKGDFAAILFLGRHNRSTGSEMAEPRYSFCVTRPPRLVPEITGTHGYVRCWSRERLSHPQP